MAKVVSVRKAAEFLSAYLTKHTLCHPFEAMFSEPPLRGTPPPFNPWCLKAGIQLGSMLLYAIFKLKFVLTPLVSPLADLHNSNPF